MNIILLSGGSGKRLWPLSNDVRSKQFIKLFKNNDEYESMVQRVYRQVTTVDADAKITIATSKSQASAIKNQLGEKASICVEPCRRDTFPAIALAAAYLHDELSVAENEAVVVCPVDPYVDNTYYEAVKKLQELAEQGVKELILVAQETTLYGVDLYGEKTLPKLLHELAQIDGIEWIRIQYCYPEEITEELIQAIKTEEKVCHYLDIPIQHASDAVLKRMGRRTNQAELRERIAHLREEIPDIALRTTLISGFPGETQEDHEELMRFVDEMEFDRLGVFAYSAEEDTPAAGYPDQVPQEVKEDRRDEIMELQQEIAFEKAEDMKDRVLEVMIEGKVADENAFVGRTYKDAPNVDGLIFVNADVPLMSGDFCRVRVTGALEYDLIGELADEFTE